jgi:hypothetical protein
MEFPRFRRDTISSDLKGSGAGEAFERFVFDLLRYEYPSLRSFPAGGKDGGIDLSATNDGVRQVFECKFIGEDGVQTARQRWRDVFNRLDEYLSDAEGPTTGQSQYEPWYNTEAVIQEYVFCVSSRLKNQSQKDELEDRIRADFEALVTNVDHLTHLQDLSVTVLDWGDFEAKLSRHPQVGLKWFPRARPLGLVPLDALPEPEGLRAYTQGQTLPYYSRADHLDSTPAPDTAEVLNERDLLEELDTDATSGLILTGSGGVGKSRLMFELGADAQEDGWVVFRVGERLRASALKDIATRAFPASTPVLLLIDYVETQDDFSELVDLINDFNAREANLNYVACCRSSYYRAIRDTSQHVRVDLTPQDDAAEWFESYRRATVRHILRETGIDVTTAHLDTCGDVPILAAFMAYLYEQGRTDELRDLLDEQDFGRWITKRLNLSFPNQDVRDEVASLAAHFPLAHESVRQLSKAQREIFRNLDADGWIERETSEEESDRWVTAHDIFADQILLTHLGDLRNATDLFVDDLLEESEQWGNLRSPLLAFQRIADQPPVERIDWASLFGTRMHAAPGSWGKVSDILVRSPLLDRSVVLDLLRSWIDEHSTLLEASYVYDAWLEAGGGLANIRSDVRTWLEKHNSSPKALFVYTAWLKAGGDLDAIRNAVRAWIDEHRTASEARFVYTAWLESDGDLDTIRGDVRDWIDEHRTASEASHVYDAWLDAGGDVSLVRPHVDEWLDEHRTTFQASFVLQAWLDAGGSCSVVRDGADAWLYRHQTRYPATFVFQAWLEAGGEAAFLQPHLTAWLDEHHRAHASTYVYQAWLDADGESDVVWPYVERWLEEYVEEKSTFHLFRSWIEAGAPADRIRPYVRRWLDRHGATNRADQLREVWAAEVEG